MALKDLGSALFSPERMPLFVGCVTLAAGTALALKPGSATRVLGIEGQEQAVRIVGLSDLALVPGLLVGNPGRLKGVAAALAALTLADGSTALKLIRIEADPSK